MSKQLTKADFEPHVGSSFAIQFKDGQLAITLKEVTTLGHGRPNTREPFSLVFIGPGKPQLPPYTYTVHHQALGTQELFLVPLGPDKLGSRYEAVFT